MEADVVDAVHEAAQGIKSVEQKLNAAGGGVWKKWALLALAILLLFGGGYATGRWAAPARTVVTEKVHEVEKQVVVTQVRTEVKVVRIHDQQTDQKVHRTVTETTGKDGTKTKTTTEDVNTDTVTHDTSNKDATKDAQQTKVVDRVVDRVTTIVKEAKKLDWRVQAGLGIAIPRFLGQPDIGVPGMQGFVVQAGVDRRILGPFWLGLFGNTQGTLGLNVSGEF